MKQYKVSYFHIAGRLILSLAILLTVIITTPATPARADDPGYALAFDGVNDLVQLTYTSTIFASTWTTTKTVEVWVKPEGPTNDCIDEPGDPGFVAACDYIFGDKPEWWGITRGEIDGLDRIWIYNFDGSMDQIGVPYTIGEWVHIAMVHGGGMLRAYKNGIQISAVASGATWQPSSGAQPVLVIGGSIFNASRVYTLQGQIDELRLWNVARSAAEINANMRLLLNGDEPELAAYYQMSDGTGTVLTDDSTTGDDYDGTLLDGCCGVGPNGLPPQWVDSSAFDVPPPCVTIDQAPSQADPTNGSTIIFTVQFSEDVTGFTGSDVDLSASTAPGPLNAVVTGNGASYTVEVSGMSASGTVTASIPAGVAQNGSAIGNSASTSTDNDVTYDNIAPTVTINQAPGQADPTFGSPINFGVIFSEEVSDFTNGDVSLTGTAGATTVVVTGGPTSYNVAVSGMTASGTVIATIAAGRAHDAAGNPNSASVSTDNTVTFDATGLTVTINQAAGQADPTNYTPILFQVVFSRSVSDFATGDVSLSGTAGADTATVSGGGTNYDVAVSGMDGSGTVIASIPAGVAHDTAGNPNGASTSTDRTVNYDVTGPTVTINQAAGQSDPTNDLPIEFTVVFNEAVDDFDGNDVLLSGTAGADAAVVSGGPLTYNVAVSGMTGSGTVIAAIPAGAAHDALGNPNTPSASSDDTVTYDITAPTVTINQASGQMDPTNDSPIEFSAVFSEPVSNFTSTDVTVTGSAEATTVMVSGGPTTYDIRVSGMVLQGTVIVSIAAGAAFDAAGNGSMASTSTDNTVTYDTIAPTVTINQASTQADPTSTSPINFTVIFSETVSDFATGDVTLSGDTGATTATVSGSGARYNVAVSGMTGSGTLIASILAGVAHDAAGNASAASSSVDHTVQYIHSLRTYLPLVVR
jgi:hypothetical protein